MKKTRDATGAKLLPGKEGEEAVNIGPAFCVIMAVGGAVLVGVALTYGVISRRGRRVEKSDSAKEK